MHITKVSTFIRLGCIVLFTLPLACDSTDSTPEEKGLEQTTQPLAPPGAGFVLNAGDLRFILRQIEIAQAHAGGGQLLGPGPNQVGDPRLPFGLRTVDGSFNHLLAGQNQWGASGELFPRMTTAFDHPGYTPTGNVVDPQPRVITNLIADQTVNNPAALSVSLAAGGGCVDVPGTRRDPTCFIGNLAPDEGLSAPFNSMFTFFGQFFDHGLDFVPKGTEQVVIPLQPDDPLFVPGSPTNFMVLSRGINQPGPDGVLGTADDIHEAKNLITPFVDQNQTYTSHPSAQVFLRAYDDDLTNPPSQTGRLLDGAGGNIGNWAEVKAQALTKLGIRLVDQDVHSVPLILTDPYGHFIPGPNGFPQIILQTGGMAEGNPSAPITTVNAVPSGHAFLDDIAFRAAPRPGLTPDSDAIVTPGAQPPGTYDDELLAAHFVTGDVRGNENIALTAVHVIFHSEHNRLAAQIGGANGISGGLIDTLLTPAEAAAWRSVDPASGWGYGERIFQAARFVTEMQYQHLVFEEFARKLVPSIDPFIGDGINMSSRFNPAIVAEFAHAVYRLGHSMLTDTISRERPDGTTYDIPLIQGFLNPLEFNRDGLGGTLTAAQAAGAIFQGGTRQRGNQIDEFVTEAVRNNVLGLPLDLGVLNLARGRSESVAPLNLVREELFLASGDPSLAPYANWSDVEFALRNPESLVNFIAAYGIHPTLAGVPACTTGPAPDCGLGGRRAAAAALMTDSTFMNGPAAQTGVNTIDLWMGGLAERPAPFGSMLGPTFTFVFERQLEKLQNEDRFYYLERLDGLNLLSQLEANSFQELIQRNSEAAGMAQDVFARPDLVLNVARINGPGNTIVDDPTTTFDELEPVNSGELTRTADGTFRYSGGLHVIWNGDDAAGDRIISSIGDDSIAGNGGDDRIESGAGNDLVTGGEGNDILVDSFGDDVIKGGPGDDAISGGPGIDLLQGNEGNDFIVAGVDASEVFGGPGNDFFYMGVGLSESIGGAGDDWFEGTISPASIGIGDDNNQFQDDPNGGHDVGVAGPGDMDFDMEGGDDIMVGSVVPTHRFEGMLGFDWVTYRGETLPVDADMLVTGAIAVNAPLNELRDRFDNVEGLSGSDLDDVLRGSNRVEADLRNDGLTGVVNGHVLSSAGIARIDGLAALLLAGATDFAGGEIILGGAGNDILEGRGGDDLLDGDAWLNVQLRGVTSDGTVRLANSLQDLRNDVFAGRLSPSTISIVRSIVPGTAGTDIDTAVYSEPFANYDVGRNLDGSIRVVHSRPAPVAGGGGIGDGVDRLTHIEILQFADITIPATAITALADTIPPAPVSGLAVSAGDAQVRLNFVPTPDAISVRILRSTVGFALSPQDLANQTIVFDALDVTFLDTGLINGTTYFYSVYTRDAGGNFSTRATGVATPQAGAVTDPPLDDTDVPLPVTLLTQTSGDGQVFLSWLNPAVDGDAVRILRSTVGFANSAIATVNQTVIFDQPGTNFRDTGLVNGTAYFYTVFARSSAGFFSAPATINATPVFGPDTTAPEPVTNLVQSIGDKRVTITWNNPTDAAAVRILRSTVGYAISPTETIDQVHVFDAPGVEFTDTDVNNGTQYFYTLFVRDAAGNVSVPVGINATPVPGRPGNGNGGSGGGGNQGGGGGSGGGCTAATGGNALTALMGLLLLTGIGNRRRRQA